MHVGDPAAQGATHYAGGTDQEEVLHLLRVAQRVRGCQVAAQRVPHQDHLHSGRLELHGGRQADGCVGREAPREPSGRAFSISIYTPKTAKCTALSTGTTACHPEMNE